MTKKHSAFTIVEMIVVIVIIAILASIVVVSYNSITQDAKRTSMESDLNNAVKDLATYRKENGEFPSDDGQLSISEGNTYTYESDGDTYCLEIKNNSLTATYFVSNGTSVKEGTCSSLVIPGVIMQTITAANCSTSRVRGIDARDNHTYWVKKMSDGKCWMLTNLAYAGGGTNTYSDTKTLNNGTNDSSETYTTAKYYVVPGGSNYTVEPADPSTSTTGAGQYGYLYNFCAANGVQTSSAACKNGTSGAINTSISICPAGWRLPSIDNNEPQALYTAVNGGSTSNDTGLRTVWLGMRAGAFWGSYDTGNFGDYWTSSTQNATNGRDFYFLSNDGGYAGNDTKSHGFSVRCIAN